MFCLFLLPFAFVFPQAEIKLDCETNLENIFKVHDFKKKFDIVENIYKERRLKESFLFSTFNHYLLNRYFILIKGFSYFELPIDSIANVKPGEPIITEYMSEEEVNEYIEQLNYTPGEAYKDYTDFIQDIKLEKELYLRCIDVELAKNFDSKYAKEILRYELNSPSPSQLLPLITKLDYLNVFKEFILNRNEVALPAYFRVNAYIECGCKTPYFRESSLRY